MAAITAATAATISAVGTIAGTAAAAGGTYMSFRGAAKQRKAADTARAEADRLMQEARKRAEENVYKSLSLSKEPYDRARESALVQGAQAIEAGMESERGSASTAGRVQMAQNEMQRDIANEQTQQIQALNMTIAEEDARLKDFTANVNMTEAVGAQLAARDADEAAADFTAQGVQGIANTAKVVGDALPLYYKTAGAQQYSKLIDQGTAAGLDMQGIQNSLEKAASNNPKYAAFKGIGSKTPQEAQVIISGLDLGTLRGLVEGNPFQTSRPIPAPQEIGPLPPNLFPKNRQYTPNSNVNPFDIYGR
jgi:hypothetical protein